MKLPLAFLLAGLLLNGFSAPAQNLVVNGSFEDYTSCPANQNQLSLAVPWVMPLNSGIASSDLFNVCNTGFQGVPTNINGYQQAHTGSGYAGIFSYGAGVREYLQAPLSAPLVAGNTYWVEMYVSATLSNNSSILSDGMGILLSDTQVTGNGTGEQLPYMPQVSNPANNIITDTAAWTKIGGFYKAHGGESWITIGNFPDDSLCHVQIVNNERYQAYFYVDDVSVTLFGRNDIDEFNAAPAGNVFPNPFSGQLSVVAPSGNKVRLQLYDALGRNVFNAESTGTFNTASLAPGVYIYRLTGEAGKVQTGKVIKQQDH